MLSDVIENQYVVRFGALAGGRYGSWGFSELAGSSTWLYSLISVGCSRVAGSGTFFMLKLF